MKSHPLTTILPAAACLLGIATPLAAGAAAHHHPAASQLRTEPAKSPRQLRILLYYDMEGASGATDVREFQFNEPEHYRRGQELLVGDVNAAVAGLFDAGATSVEVADSHGSGNPGPDVPEASLDKRARMVVRDKPFEPYLGIVAPGAYDAVVAIGMHARGGGRGFLAHTFRLGNEVLLNGSALSESEVVGLAWGQVGVPLIFVSGDDALRDELAGRMPWVRSAVVKRYTGGVAGAEPLPLQAAREAIRKGAAESLRDLPRAQVLTATWPAKAALHALPPTTLMPLRRVPGIDYADEQVTFSAANLQEAVRGWAALGGVAMQFGALSVTQAMLDESSERPGAWQPRFLERWLAAADPAKARQAPGDAPPASAAPGRFYGAQ